RMLHVGFWHQDHELITTIAGDNIGAPAICLQNVTDTLENEIAFEVAVKVVDEFKAVEIHQNKREGAARTSRALPLGGKSFHEKAMRFDAGESDSDSLFLSFLERESVVERAGNEVGKRAEKQDLFL